MTAQEAPETPDLWLCRYRYATGCTAKYDTKHSVLSHERTAVAHDGHRVTLLDCPRHFMTDAERSRIDEPVCLARCGSEAMRAMHLSNDHRITANSARRSELDALQVKEAYDAQQTAGPDATANLSAEPAVLNGTGTFEPNPPSVNGHAPAEPDVAAAQVIFAALIAEVQEHRAWRAAHADVESDAARYRQIKSITQD